MDVLSLDALPRDLLLHLLRFLSGFDLLPLSHTNTLFYAELLDANSAFWATHVPQRMRLGPYHWHELATFGWRRVRSSSLLRPRRSNREAARLKREQRKAERARDREARETELLSNAKRHYFASVSLQFPGLGIEGETTQRRSGRVALYQGNIEESWPTESFSFDVWCALLPTMPSGGIVGGVLFSAQSATSYHPQAPDAVAHFVHVDSNGGLYCSVATETKRVVATLEVSRWYHIALTWDRPQTDGASTQRVYLDGVCIDTETNASLPTNWAQLKEFQLGSGFMDEQSIGRPDVRESPGNGWLFSAVRFWRGARPPFRGYYSFRGVVNDFRLWQGVLSPDDLAQLRRGRDVTSSSAACRWSLMRHGDFNCFHGDLWAVHCTRPTERVCSHVERAFRVWSLREIPS